jgi:putative DNA primase/helicase
MLKITDRQNQTVKNTIISLPDENQIEEAKVNFYATSINLCREVLDHIRRMTYHKHDKFDSDLNIINLKNGLYHVLENRLEPHTPKYLSLNQKPITYNPNAIPKRFAKFLSEVIYLSDMPTMVDLMGYSFHRENLLEIITYLHGFGGNGKSVIFNLLLALHGDENVSHVSLRLY